MSAAFFLNSDHHKVCERCGVERTSTEKREDGKRRCDECEATMNAGNDDPTELTRPTVAEAVVDLSDVWEDDGE